MTKKTMLLFCLVILSILSIYSQSLQIFDETAIKENPQVKRESPSAYAMSRYDNIDINEYLGIPNISIPLYNLKLSDIDIPLSLSYDATGIKVNQDATSVGIGWNLNSLGSITQIVRGDDDMHPYIPEVYRLLPDYFSSNYATLQDLPSEGYLLEAKRENYVVESVKEQYGYRMIYNDYFPINGKFVMNSKFRYSTTYWDSEPDVFIINILGQRLHCVTSDFPKNITPATIISSRSRRITVLNKVGYKVSIGTNNNSWVVTDPNGTRFYFELKQTTMSDNIIATSMYGTEGSSNNVSKDISSNTWFLTKIETVLGTKVNLDYETSDEVTFTTYGNGAVEYIYSLYQTKYDPGYPPYYFLDMFINKAPINYSKTTSKSAEKQYRLASISSNNSLIKFNYSDREDIPNYQKIDSIECSFYQEESIKKIKFSYEYKTNYLDKSKRLFLNSLNVNGELFKFKYNTVQLPPRNSYAQDYWGYYNGSLENTSLVPNPKRFGLIINESYYPSETFKNNMSANLNYTKAGVLEKITYPTNGSVEFEYELNTFRSPWVPNYTATNSKTEESEGFGLRIKSTIHKDSSSKILKRRTYKYYGGKSVVFHDFKKSANITWVPSQAPSFRFDASYYVMSTSSLSNVNPFSTHTGIGYDSVSSIFESLDDKIKYKTTTYFHNVQHYSSAYQSVVQRILHTVNMPSFENSRYPKNGSVIEKRYYNSSDKLVKKEAYQYENKKSSLFYGVKIMKLSDVYKSRPDAYYWDPGISRYLLAYYPIFDFETLVTQKIDKTYDNHQSIDLVTDYEYNLNRTLSKTIVTNSQDEIISQILKYPTDFNTMAIYQNMVSKNILSPVVTKTILSHNGTLLNEVTTNYTLNLTNSFILPSSIQSNSSTDNNNLRTDMTYDLYDSKGNILQCTTLDGVSTSYLWSYYGEYPIAEIKNATYEKVKDALNILGLDVSNLNKFSIANMAKIEALRDKLPNTMIKTYTYKPLVGILTATDARGLKTYYEYDALNRLKEVYIIENGQKRVLEAYVYSFVNQ